MRELRNIERILAIRLARLGDIALLLPALARLTAAFPRSQLALLTGSRYAPLARMSPQLDNVFAVNRLAMRDGPRIHALVGIKRLLQDVRLGQYDLVIDFHSFRETNLLAWLSGAPQRMGMKRADRAYLPFCFNLPYAQEDKSIHVAEMFDRVVENLPIDIPVSREPVELLKIPDDVSRRVEARVSGLKNRVAFYVGASVIDRRWPSSSFGAVVDHVLSQWNASVLILAGTSPAEQAVAEETVQAVRNKDQVRVLTNLTIPELVGAIKTCELMISNDTGPMHIGSLLGVPTLGIFSLSEPLHYRPVGKNDRYVKKNSVTDIEVREVVAIADEMWATASLCRRP